MAAGVDELSYESVSTLVLTIAGYLDICHNAILLIINLRWSGLSRDFQASNRTRWSEISASADQWCDDQSTNTQLTLTLPSENHCKMIVARAVKSIPLEV